LGEPILFYTHEPSGELFRRRWRLFVAEGPDRPRSVEVLDAPAIIGAAPASTLVLTDDTVSRYHAELDIFAEGLRVRDLDSTNGTFLVGEDRIQEGFVENGGTFRVGRTTIRLVAVDEPAASEIETDPRGVPLGEPEVLGGLIAKDPASRELFRQIRRVARSISPVLLEGPIGAGKGALARLIHDLSPRKDQPFRTLAAAIAPEASLGRLLFGTPEEAGLFEQANPGTLYIEDVDRLPPGLQDKLRRAIERGEIVREGEEKSRRVDVRLLSATAGGTAGLDPELGRRIATVRLKVLGLGARREDLPLLAEVFLRRGGREHLRLGAKTIALLHTQRWPRNLKDLEAVIGRMRTFGNASAPTSFEGMLRGAFLAELLQDHGGHVGKAARALEVSERTLHAELKRADVDLGL
jgi:two-component system, NtrC family, response regulator GlrR